MVVKKDGISLKRSQRKAISMLSQKKVYYSSIEKINEPKTTEYYQRLIGHLFSAGQISPRFKQIGHAVVRERRELGINAENQNSPRN